jgi:hypothetical protein
MRLGRKRLDANNTEASMLDIIYIAVGTGFFALMALYARWAANA